MTKKYTQKTFQSDLLKLENFINKYGGSDNSVSTNSNSSSNSSSSNSSSSLSSDSKVRHFKLIEADKKELNIGYVKISNAGSPLSAAKKLFKSLCHHRNLSGENKLKCKSTFTIQETTQDSKKKIFGPYIGSWKKLSEKEQKEAERAGIKFTMRSVVKLLSSNNKSKNSIDDDVSVSSTTSTNSTLSAKSPKPKNVKGGKKNKTKNSLEKIGG